MPRTSSLPPFHRSGRSFIELSLEPNRSGHSSFTSRASSTLAHGVDFGSPGAGGRRSSGRRASAASRVGSDGTAPATLTAYAPAADASAIPRSVPSIPSAMATPSAALNASPAAVPSTTRPPGTATGGYRAKTPSSPIATAPRSPRVTMTRLAPRATSARPAAATSSSVRVGKSVSLASSDSFGHR